MEQVLLQIAVAAADEGQLRIRSLNFSGQADVTLHVIGRQGAFRIVGSVDGRQAMAVVSGEVVVDFHKLVFVRVAGFVQVGERGLQHLAPGRFFFGADFFGRASVGRNSKHADHPRQRQAL